MTTNNVGPTMLYAHCTSWDLEMVTMLLELGSSVSRASVEHAFCDNMVFIRRIQGGTNASCDNSIRPS